MSKDREGKSCWCPRGLRRVSAFKLAAKISAAPLAKSKAGDHVTPKRQPVHGDGILRSFLTLRCGGSAARRNEIIRRAVLPL